MFAECNFLIHILFTAIQNVIVTTSLDIIAMGAYKKKIVPIKFQV